MPDEVTAALEANSPTSDPDQAGSEDAEAQTSDPAPAFALLQKAVFSDVKGWVEEDRARRRTATLTVTSISMVALIAIGGFLVNQLLVFNVERRVDQAVSDNLSSVTFQSRLAALNFRVVALDRASAFSNEDAHLIIQSIETLYKSGVGEDNIPADVESQNISDLMFAVETAVESFTSADRVDLVTQVTSVAPRVAEQSSRIAPIVVRLTAYNLIGMAGGADAWLDGTGREYRLYDVYERYVERARDTGYPELYLAFELILRHMAGRPGDEILELGAEVEDLNEIDEGAFIDTMEMLVEGELFMQPTAVSERVKERTREFLDAFGSSIPALTRF